MGKFKIDGCWEKTPSRAMCLWMAVWKDIKPLKAKGSPLALNRAGVIGGYCGGGLFELEQFVASSSNKGVSSLWIGSEDKIRAQEVDFSILPGEILDTCHEALEEMWDWNSENNWLEGQQLRLYPYNESGLQKRGDLFYKIGSEPLLVRSLCQSLSLVSAPSLPKRAGAKPLSSPSV